MGERNGTSSDRHPKTIRCDRIMYTDSPWDSFREEPGWVRVLVKDVDVTPDRIWFRLVTSLPIDAATGFLAAQLVDRWPTINPSRDTLCAVARMHPQLLQYAVEALESAGLLEVERRHGERSVYHLCWPFRAVTAEEWNAFRKQRPAGGAFGGSTGGTTEQEVVPPVELVGGSTVEQGRSTGGTRRSNRGRVTGLEQIPRNGTVRVGRER